MLCKAVSSTSLFLDIKVMCFSSCRFSLISSRKRAMGCSSEVSILKHSASTFKRSAIVVSTTWRSRWHWYEPTAPWPVSSYRCTAMPTPTAQSVWSSILRTTRWVCMHTHVGNEASYSVRCVWQCSLQLLPAWEIYIVKVWLYTVYNVSTHAIVDNEVRMNL